MPPWLFGAGLLIFVWLPTKKKVFKWKAGREEVFNAVLRLFLFVLLQAKKVFRHLDLACKIANHKPKAVKLSWFAIIAFWVGLQKWI